MDLCQNYLLPFLQNLGVPVCILGCKQKKPIWIANEQIINWKGHQSLTPWRQSWNMRLRTRKECIQVSPWVQFYEKTLDATVTTRVGYSTPKS